MKQLLVNQLRLAQDQLLELTISTESDFKYRGFVEDWNEEEILLKYVGSEKNDRCLVIRWLPLATITEVAYMRESNLDEAWMSNDHESSLRFADDFPGVQSDVIIEEILDGLDDDFEGVL